MKNNIGILCLVNGFYDLFSVSNPESLQHSCCICDSHCVTFDRKSFGCSDFNHHQISVFAIFATKSNNDYKSVDSWLGLGIAQWDFIYSLNKVNRNNGLDGFIMPIKFNSDTGLVADGVLDDFFPVTGDTVFFLIPFELGVHLFGNQKGKKNESLLLAHEIWGLGAPNARAKGRGRTKLGETGQSATPRPIERRVGRRTRKE